MAHEEKAHAPFVVLMDGPQSEVIDAVTEALSAEGFGVLTRIDIDRALDEKLGVDFRPYAILGACNPSLAHRALNSRADVGLLLPCNVVVDQEHEGRTVVRIIDPMEMLGSPGYDDDPELAAVAEEARGKLIRVAEALAAGASA